MKNHSFWGKIEADWAGFSAEITFSNLFFGEKKVSIFLGEEYDDDGEEIEKPASKKHLDKYAIVYQDFIANINKALEEMQTKAFERYINVYAHHFENSEKSGNPPLNIDSVEKHDEYIKEIMFIRILEDKNILVRIRYKIDQEHGLEFRFENGKIIGVGGIAET